MTDLLYLWATLALLPTLLVAAWVLVWYRQRHVGWRFFATGLGLSILCIPAGSFAEAMATRSSSCTPQDTWECGLGMARGMFWVNGFLAVLCLAGLAVLSLMVRLRHRSRNGDAQRS